MYLVNSLDFYKYLEDIKSFVKEECPAWDLCSRHMPTENPEQIEGYYFLTQTNFEKGLIEPHFKPVPYIFAVEYMDKGALVRYRISETLPVTCEEGRIKRPPILLMEY